ncbi:MAG: putative zinc-binding metallopeptidase [Cyclobacteriaceae bacterium]|nr:putative zinc-binding metallopeptidase [Cyclobacteriaceae bacterium]
MKNKSVYWILGLFVILLSGCNSENDNVSAGSNLSTDPQTRNKVDKWIKDNYTDPYNIDVAYRWTESLTDQGRYLSPAHIDSVIPALKIIKKLWIDPYSQVGGADFVKKIAPRQIVLVGGLNVNPSGTITLGLAEAGKRITLFNVNLLEKKNRYALTQFIKTIQHEYVHILNQTKPFNVSTWGRISPEGYTAQWFNENDPESRSAGFITAYARANESEDFAEMASEMLGRSFGEWNTLITSITPPSGITKIRVKEKIVSDYYLDNFKVNIYTLQDSVYRATIRLTR